MGSVQLEMGFTGVLEDEVDYLSRRVGDGRLFFFIHPDVLGEKSVILIDCPRSMSDAFVPGSTIELAPLTIFRESPKWWTGCRGGG